MSHTKNEADTRERLDAQRMERSGRMKIKKTNKRIKY